MTMQSDGSTRSSDPSRPWLGHYPPNIDWFAPIAEKPLFELIDHAVATYPNNVAIDFLNKTYTYREIGDLVKRTARGLQDIGVARGTKVGLFLPNCPYSVIFFFAILKAGGVVVNYNPLYAERELIHQIEDSETDIFITLDVKALYEKVPPLLSQTRLGKVVICRLQDALPFPKNKLYPLVKRKDVATFPLDERHVRFVDLIANDGRFAQHPVDPAAEPAVLQYTGGTTGVPKGAMLSHANLYANAMQCEKWFPEGVPGGERVLGVLPLFHVFAMTTVMTYGVYGGAVLVLLPRFEIVQLLETITKKKPTMMPAVPTLFTAINNYKDLKKYDLSSLKYCISGGAALPLEVKSNFEKLSGCTLVEGYGLSETSPVATCNPLRGTNKSGSIGLPLPGTTIEICVDRAPDPHAADRRARRGVHQRPAGHDRLLEAARRDRAGDRRRTLPHRRHRLHGRGGLYLHRRPAQGDDHRRRLQHLSAQCRGGDLPAPGGRRMRRGRPARSLSRPDGQGLCPAGRRRQARRRRPASPSSRTSCRRSRCRSRSSSAPSCPNRRSARS